jgi:hypothetical protein
MALTLALAPATAAFASFNAPKPAALIEDRASASRDSGSSAASSTSSKYKDAKGKASVISGDEDCMMNVDRDRMEEAEIGHADDEYDDDDRDREYHLYEKWCAALSQAGPAAAASASLGHRHLFQYATSRGVSFVPVSSSHILGVVATAAPSRRTIKRR